jgi:hypothetical protein
MSRATNYENDAEIYARKIDALRDLKAICGEQHRELWGSGWRVFKGYECPKCGEGAVIIMSEAQDKNMRGHMECVKCMWRTF